jgi:hypothetical protein
MKYYYTPSSIHKSPFFAKDCLADIISEYYKHVLGKSSSRAEFLVDLFGFYFCEHNTGVSIAVKIIAPDKTERKIIDCTYWFSSTYTFNTCFFESGKWDNRLEKTIDKMLENVNLSIRKKEEEETKVKQEKLAKELAEKQKFESLFNE